MQVEEQGSSGAPAVTEKGLLNTNLKWSRHLVEALVSHGVHRAILSPGGRVSALAMALNESPQITLSNYVDERVAGFRAIGRLGASGEPVALCTTSGSAVANALPALAEAHARSLRLVLITCDRPRIHRGLHPPQSIDQLSICSPFVCRQLDCCDPRSEELEVFRCQLQEILTVIKEIGPIHINLPQWGEYCALESDPVELMSSTAQQHNRHGHATHQCSKVCSNHTMRAVLRDSPWPDAKRALIIVGAHPPIGRSAITRVVETTSIPLLADLASGLRRPAPPELVFASDMQGNCLKRLSPDVVLRIGAPPISPYLHRWLSETKIPVIHLVARGRGPDWLNPEALVVKVVDCDEVASALCDLAPSLDIEWRNSWLRFSKTNVAVSSLALSFLPWGELAAIGSIVAHPDYKLLCIGNSLSIRLAEIVALPWETDQVIIVNRGVNGIDGTVSTFLGYLEECGQHGLLLLGDQALQHDLSALGTVDHSKHRGAICVIDNRGPGVFQFSEGYKFPGFRQSMCINTSICYEHLALLFGIRYHHCTDCDSLNSALGQATGDTCLHLVHCDLGVSHIKSDLLMFSRACARLSLLFGQLETIS